jgi:hypothetical protein
LSIVLAEVTVIDVTVTAGGGGVVGLFEQAGIKKRKHKRTPQEISFCILLPLL